MVVEYILEDQPDLLTSLWETVHDLIDRLLLPSQENTLSNMTNQHGADWQETWSCVADCAIEVILLLHNTHTRFPNSAPLTSEEDRAMMVHFCLELMDELAKGHYVAYQPQPASDPRVLAFVLVSWVTRALSESLGSGRRSEGVAVETLVAWLGMLLDGLCESLLREVSGLTMCVIRSPTFFLACFYQKMKSLFINSLARFFLCGRVGRRYYGLEDFAGVHEGAPDMLPPKTIAIFNLDSNKSP